MKLLPPLWDLPLVIGAPDQLHREVFQLTKPISNLQRMDRVVVLDLVLKQARLPYRARNIIQIRLKRAFFEPVFFVYSAKQPVPEMRPMGGLGRFHQRLKTILHLLLGPP